ncbi:ATP-binding protein [Bacteroidota bacterium]
MKKLVYIFLCIAIFFFARIIESKYIKFEQKEIKIKNIENVFNKKIEFSKRITNELKQIIEDNGSQSELYYYLEGNKRVFQKEQLVYLVFQKDTLLFWSDNSLPLNQDIVLDSTNRICENLDNGWFLINTDTVKNHQIVTLSLIKREYPYTNKFLNNEFHPDYRLPSETGISNMESEQGINVYSSSGQFICNLIPNEKPYRNDFLFHLSFILYAIAIAFFLIFLAVAIKQTIHKNIYILFIIALILFIRYLLAKFNFPDINQFSELFNPDYFSSSLWISSLGDLLIHAVFLLFITFIVQQNLILKLTNKKKANAVFYISSFIVLFYFSLIILLFQCLVYDSTISFEFYKILNISRFSLLGFVIITLLFISLILISDKLISLFMQNLTYKQFVIRFLISSIIFSVIWSFYNSELAIYSILFLILLFLFILRVRYIYKQYTFTSLVAISLIISLFTLVFIEMNTALKIKKESKVIAVNLANERDHIGELLLEQAYNKIKTDTFIYNFFNTPFEKPDELYNYLSSSYFTGYLKKYDFQVTICDPLQDLLIENTNELVPCYSFFQEMMTETGIKIPNSDFYFIDNKNGRISYLGIITFDTTFYNTELSIFISLDSRLVGEQLGYPELLLEEAFNQPEYLKKYSYAKYNNDQLITQSGNFPYSLVCQFACEMVDSANVFTYFKRNNFNHLVYKADEENIIILSYPRISFINILLSFTYIFVLYFILLLLIILFSSKRREILYVGIQNDFKNRIKFSIISVLFLSFIVMGGGTIYYSKVQYENKQYENLREKLQSVLIELEHKIGYEQSLNESWTNYLTGLLRKFSNVFYTDIHLYDFEGYLLASSRPEIFENNLTSHRMNAEAYYHLILNKEARFIHKEDIGKLKYYSAYVPLKNMENNLLAYLNLPYFTKQNVLSEEIYTLIVAIVNIYTLLISISILIAVFVSNQITKPLRLIQEKFKKVGLNYTNEQIDYESNDEIGGLIKEYNRMVMELATSAEKLARTEREIAWREMAKQIAHEIKNPLTPMKLSIQHLQRAWDDKVENWDEYLDKVSKTLIEQIDHLTFIATEFSNFAKMPKANNTKVNIIDKINKCLILFSNYNNIDFKLNYNKEKEIFVFADKEQLIRIFTNLIKNSIQSIDAKNKKGYIDINIDKEKSDVLIIIKDNGKGIPDELKSKLFEPSFTTKSSGMGLGLAIVKNIITNLGGDIWFETQINKGTTFYIKLPLYK